MHKTVLLREAVELLVTDTDGLYVDGTFGRGGHSRAILDRLGPRGRLLAIDQDPDAIASGAELARRDARLELAWANFDALAQLLEQHGMTGRLTGLLLDLGVSSPQLDQADRGFSFQHDGPLDMRMDPEHGESAADWINRVESDELVRVLKDYGEERFARRMAAAVLHERAQSPITSTARLAGIIAAANPAWEKGKHPATRAFQAIRIHVNRELDVLRSVLDQALMQLKPGGRLVVISFHSLEDRIVKRFMRDASRWQHGPTPAHDIAPVMNLLTRKMTAPKAELDQNPRARSAVLRAAEKCGDEVVR